MRLRLLWPGLGLLPVLPACSFAGAFRKPVARFRYKPHPRQRYDLTTSIANAPGAFAGVAGRAQYDVSNGQGSTPPESNPGGYSSHMTRRVPFALTRVSEAHYSGKVSPSSTTPGVECWDRQRHKFNLHGETFNSCGALSLGYQLREGGSQVMNHVKASAPVSAAGGHFGEVRLYASGQDRQSGAGGNATTMSVT